MRLLLIANTLPPRDVSGVGEQVLQLAAGLREQGVEVEVLGRGEGGARGPKVLFPLTVVPALWRALRRFQPHCVQVHESDGALAALFTVLFRRWLRPRPRVLALLQVSYVEELRAVRPIGDGKGRVLGQPGAVERRFRRFKAPLQIALGRLTARLADRVLAPSARTLEELRADYGVTGGEVLPNVTGGLDVGAEEAPPELGEGFLLFVGRLRIRKGVEVLLEAMRELGNEGTGARLLIVGDGEHREFLESFAAERGVTDSVSFLGRRSAGQVRGLLERSRALVVPSTYEGMPLVVLEAMERAVPIVASAVSGIPEVVLDGETGWLVPSEDVASLTAALQDALTRPEEAERRGEIGRERVEACYRPRHAAASWLSMAQGLSMAEGLSSEGERTVTEDLDGGADPESGGPTHAA